MLQKDFHYIICGHYGSGKTNVSVNLAIRLKQTTNFAVTLVDLDIVNPYFRAADNTAMLERLGIRTLNPQFANTNVDVPSLTGDINAIFTGGVSVIDVGGDDSGAVALGGYAARIQQFPYEMLLVVNQYRPQSAHPDDAVRLAREIESAGRLNISGIVNNSNLAYDTTATTVRASYDYAEAVCGKMNLPLFRTTVLESLRESFSPAEIEARNICFIRDITRHYDNERKDDKNESGHL